MATSIDLLPVEPAEIAGQLLVTCVRYDPVLLEEHDWHSTKSGGEAKSSYLLLPFHVQRLHAAAKAFGWPDAIDVLSRDDARQWFQDQCESALTRAGAIPQPPGDKSAYKLRCLLEPDGNLEIRVKPASGRPFDLLGAPYMTPAYLHPLTPTTLMTWPTAYAPILKVFLDVAPSKATGTAYYKHTNRDRYLAARKRLGIDPTNSVDEVILYNTAGEVTEASLRNISVWRDGGWVTPPLSSGCMDGSVRRWMLSTKKVREARILKGGLRPGEWILTSNAIEGCCFGKFVGMGRDEYDAVPDQENLPGHSTIDYPFTRT